jgi:hypothetical protein
MSMEGMSPRVSKGHVSSLGAYPSYYYLLKNGE